MFRIPNIWMRRKSCSRVASSSLFSTAPNKNKFEVTAPHEPMGDQPQAIQRLVHQVKRGDKYSILKGITGTGKTYVMAHTIAKVGKPTLVLCHNKTLAAQLTRELRTLLSKNHVHLFVSYYNHYVPESYCESANRYTAKKSSVNEEIDALRHLATRSLVQHSDVVVVASVSCIYGLGMPKSYLDASLKWAVGDVIGELKDIVMAMTTTMYGNANDERSDDNNDEDEYGTAFQRQDDYDLERGQYSLSYTNPNLHDTFGTATLVIWPPSESFPMRIDFEEYTSSSNTQSLYKITSIAQGHTKGMFQLSSTTIFPAKHHISDSREQFNEALRRITNELSKQVKDLWSQDKQKEAERLSKRVNQDLQLIRETGFCSGIENYSRHFALKEAGEPPNTLLDYFGHVDCGNNENGGDWLLMVDESHVALPQLKAMFGGDQARKRMLVKHGYRLPSALDNRPLRYDEFFNRVPQAIFVSATPSQPELDYVSDIDDNEAVDMVIRPTYICDPEIQVRPTKGQLKDLSKEIKLRTEKKERALVMTLTKRDAEDLADYLLSEGISSSYIHSGLNTHERSETLKSLQTGEIDCLVGVNLLREGLDLPEVSLVAILNCCSEGFLRSETALLQIIGRSSRNINGKAILYANRITESMKKCITATTNRRKIQLSYNAKHGKDMKSTKGSSVLSIFDILKDQIETESNNPVEIVKTTNQNVGGAQARANKLVSLSPSVSKRDIVTDHIPSKPGVYFWKDSDKNVLYIGKAKKLRSRVKSYLSPSAKHSLRVETMLKKASCVEFILCPSERDALLLESNLIKEHQPLYNILLKDDQSYPYICAKIGDAFPEFIVVPSRQHTGDTASSKYKYFGPYCKHIETILILEGIEDKYGLRMKSFEARFGSGTKSEYQKAFMQAMNEVFEPETSDVKHLPSLNAMRSKYEEASLLFDSNYNKCRDVIAIGETSDNSSVVVYVLQLRDGMVAGQFSYTIMNHHESLDLRTEEGYAETIQFALAEKHYPSGGVNGQYSFFPDEVLVQYDLSPEQKKRIKDSIRFTKKSIESNNKIGKLSVTSARSRGKQREIDNRTLQCAIDNAQQVAWEESLENSVGVPKSSVDGTAMNELISILSLEKEPKRIECYDISHTQGEASVGSRVVFINGIPAPHLYRRFNIKTVDGVDDYSSLTKVLERRFRRAWVNGKGGLVDESDPWSMPDLVVVDGGKGQMSAALKGMSKANIYTTPFDRNEEQKIKAKSDGKGREAFVPIVALAKREEALYVNEISDPINEKPDSPALLLLRSLRDESHRFALKAHRKRRSKLNGL